MAEFPEKIWAIEKGYPSRYRVSCSVLEHRLDEATEYVRADLYAALEAKLAEARQAVALFEDYGCPVCHGDCASANPPVQFCPMEIAHCVREGGK